MNRRHLAETPDLFFGLPNISVNRDRNRWKTLDIGSKSTFIINKIQNINNNRQKIDSNSQIIASKRTGINKYEYRNSKLYPIGLNS